MAYLYRLAGSLILSDGRSAFLIGDTKRPCDFVAAGFVDPGPIEDAATRPWRRLRPIREIEPTGESVEVPACDEKTAMKLAGRLLVTRNSSVSERIWDLIVDEGAPSRTTPNGVDGRWIVEAPDFMFEAMREQVLRCS